jgi:hypothetical protein
MLLSFRFSRFFRLFAALLLGGPCLLSSAYADAPYVTWSTVGTGYGNGVDTCSFRNNSIYTVGNYQFVAYYNASGYVTVARRDISTNAWANYATSYTAYNINDDHDVISFGIDGEGYMHLSWGMHGDTMRYAKSTGSVLGAGSISFTSYSAIGDLTTGITYPEFYNLSDGDLLYVCRTGGSGNGDTKYARYDTATDTWSNSTELINGNDGSIYWYTTNGSSYTASYDRNAYSNNMVFDSQGRVLMSWTWRETSNYQTNHDIMFAYATDENLTTWLNASGSSQTVPITITNASIVKSIPTGYSLMNQCSMTVDVYDNPLVATYWSPLSGSGNQTRQYMLVWYDGTSWQTSQISNRTISESRIENNDATRIRQMGRPVVLVDDDNRTIVITRSNDQNNVVTAYYSNDKTTWYMVNLTTADTGRYEPTYDEVRWANENILNLFYEPAFANSDGSRSQGAQTVSVLQWNALHYLRDYFDVQWVGGNTSGASNWGITGNWTNCALPPDGKWTNVTFGNQSSSYSVVDLVSAGRTVGNITFTDGVSTTIMSSGGYSLTLDNEGETSTIDVEGSHAISVPLVLSNDLDITGTGTLSVAFPITGDHTLNVESGTLDVGGINIDSLVIGNGAKVVIQLTASSGLGGNLTPVPEPTTLIILAMGAICALIYAWRRKIR